MSPNLLVKKSIISFPAICVLLFLMLSCISQRDLQYMRGKSNPVFPETTFTDYHLKPNDALYIQIQSIDDAASNVFAQSGIQQTLDPYGAYMNSYTVDKEGYVNLPVIGKINVNGKTTTDVSIMITDSVSNILSMPTVTVKLVNRFVSVLGEVRTPGHFVYSQDKLTIFNALGLAGDITEYGDRKSIVIARNIDGQNKIIKLDLTRPEILESQYYLIQPNDLIYVKPIRKRIWGMQEFPFTLILSTITTALVVYTFVDQH